MSVIDGDSRQTHFNIRVSGRVQGVHFRYSAKSRASELGLAGFVRNEEDGAVYLEVEGPLTLVGNLITWCKKGPPLAQVTDVSVAESEIKGFEGFEIRR